MEVPGERFCYHASFFYERSHNFFVNLLPGIYGVKMSAQEKSIKVYPKDLGFIDACIKTGVRNARMNFQTSAPIVILILS